MSDETKTGTDTSDARGERIADAAERLVHNLFDVGRLWAAHGLDVGRSALETTASTLRTTADLLGDLSRRFETPEEKTEDPSAA